MQFVKPVPWQEAIGKLGRRSLIGSSLNTEQWSRVPLGLRERAFWSSQIESIRFLQRGRDGIADFLQSAREEITLPDGTKTTALKIGSRADFIKQMQAFAIKEGMGPLDPADAGSIKDIRTERRLGLIFDTQVRQAQAYGDWQQGQDPDVLNAFPAQRFIRERAVKEPRDTHYLHENEVQLKTNLGFWRALNQDFGVPWGPWGWGCGHDVEDVDRDEAERLGLLRPEDNVTPVERDFNDQLQASVKGLDDDMQRELKEAFGDQVEISGDAARWTGTERQESTAPAPAPKPIGKPTLESVLETVQIDETKPATAADMTRLVDELKEERPLEASEVLRDIDAPATGLLAKTSLRTDLQRFVDFIPSDKLKALPKVQISGVKSLGRSRGEYSPSTKTVRVAASVKTAEQRRRTLFHELMHWVHLEGSSDFQKAIKDHYEQRTKGESIQQLPGYDDPKIIGKKDKWYEVYAGRMYPGLAVGAEVPTRYIEWLTMPPDRQAELWNDPDFRETLKIVLKALF